MKIIIDEDEVINLVLEHVKKKFNEKFNLGSMVLHEDYNSLKESYDFKGYIIELNEKDI